MAFEIGDLIAYLGLDDQMSEAFELAEKRMAAMEDGAKKLDLVIAGLGASAVAAGMAILHMAEKGAGIQDIANQFKYLTAKVGLDAVAAMKNLREGTRGTMTDFDLMHSSLRLLNMGFKGSAEDMGILAQAAFNLAEQGMGIEQAFNMINTAMVTGRPQLLRRYGITIDMAEATRKLKEESKAHGVAATAESTAMAKQAAVMQALTKYVKEGLTVTSDFGDRMARARTSVANFTEDLYKTIAASPALNDAFDRVERAFTQAVGGDKELLLRKVADAVEWVAGRVGDLAVAAINMGAVVTKAVKDVVTWWDGLPGPVHDAARALVEFLAKAVLVTAAIGSLIKAATGMYAAFMMVASPVSALAGTAFTALTLASKTLLWVWTQLGLELAVLWERFGLLTVGVRISEAAMLQYTNITRAASATVKGLTTWVSGLSVVQGVNLAATNALGIAKNLLHAVYVRLTTSISMATAALGLNTVATSASTVAHTAAKVAVGAAGVAYLALQAAAAGAAGFFIGWNIGKWADEWLHLSDYVGKAATGLGEFFGILEKGSSQQYEAMRAAQKQTESTSQLGMKLAEVSPALRAYQDQLLAAGRAAGKSGDDLIMFVNGAIASKQALVDSVTAMSAQYRALMAQGKDGVPGLKKLAEEALAAKQAGALLSPELEGLTKRFAKLTPEVGEASAAMKKATQTLAELSAYKAADLTEWMAKYQTAAGPVQVATDKLSTSQQALILSYRDMGMTAGQTALLLGTTETAVKRVTETYDEHAKSVLARNAGVQATLQKNMEDTKAGLQAIAATRNQAQQDVLEGLREYQEKNKQALLSGTALELRQIDVAEQAELSKYRLQGQLTDQLHSQIKTFYQHQRDLVNQTYGTIEERVKRAGLLTIEEYKQQLVYAKQWYEYLKTHGFPQETVDKAKAAMKAIEEIISPSKWGKFGDAISAVGDVFSNINSRAGQMIQVVGNAFKVITKDGVEAGSKIAAGFAAAASIIQDLLGGSTSRWAGAATGAAAGAASGAAIGAAWGGVGAGYGAAIGGIVGAVSGYAMAMKQAREANRMATEEVKRLEAELVKQYGSLKNISIIGNIVGVDLAGAWGDQSQEGLKHFKQLLTEFQDKMDTLQSALEEYGLTWLDLGEDFRAMTLQMSANKLLEQYQLLTAAGVEPTKALKGMSGAFSQLIVDAVQSGQKIPAALQPILEQLIRMGGLTDEAARAMLGLTESTMPSLEDIRAAAERYGLKLDDLGSKVKQLQITEAANQIAADWQILINASAPVDVLLSKMGGSVQDLVSKSLQFGLELPSAMRPVVEAMIAAGELTDATGNKLTDIGKLTFAQDLAKDFDLLIKKLTELIDKIAGVGDAALNVPDVDVDATINYHYGKPETFDEYGGYAPAVAEGAARGARVTASGLQYLDTGGKVLRFVPRGTDTQPAMLTPGERVLNVAETRAYEAGGSRVVNLTVNNEIKCLDSTDFQEIIETKLVPGFTKAIRDNAYHEGEKFVDTVGSKLGVA